MDKDLFDLEKDSNSDSDLIPEHDPQNSSDQQIVLFYVENALLGFFLTLSELQKRFNKTEQEISQIFNSKIELLKDFNLNPPSKPQENTLTELQLKVLHKITNPYDQRSLNTLLKEINVTSEQHRAWMTYKPYLQLYNRLIKTNSVYAQGEVVRKVTAKATQGDSRSIDTFFKLHGLQQEQTNPTDLILEALQKRLTPQELLEVATELKQLEP